MSADLQQTPQPPAIALVVALSIEAGGILDRMSSVVTTQCAHHQEHVGRLGQHKVLLVEAGVGQAAAGRATQDTIGLYRPRGILSVGFSGSLSPDLGLHQILMPESVVAPERPALHVGFEPSNSLVAGHPTMHRGRLVTVDHLVRTPDERSALARAHDAIACDMETYAVAHACQVARIPFLSVRIISDTFDQSLPPEIATLLQQKTAAARWGAAAGVLFRNPKRIQDLWQLREQAISATDRLAQFLEELLPSVFGPSMNLQAKGQQE